tara:strand:+ start:408 stop:692 length:285 start_codon:yes stop_codon:yes gene_type:complete
MEMHMQDKMPLKSKKFIAYLLAEFGWKLIILFLLYQIQGKIDHYTLVLLVTTVIVSGFIQIGYILGQAALDKYVNAAVEIFDKEEDKDIKKDEK